MWNSLSMFGYHNSFCTPALVVSVLVLRMVTAATPCPGMTSYTLLLNLTNGQCICVNSNPGLPAVVRILFNHHCMRWIRMLNFYRKTQTPRARIHMILLAPYALFVSHISYHLCLVDFISFSQATCPSGGTRRRREISKKYFNPDGSVSARLSRSSAHPNNVFT